MHCMQTNGSFESPTKIRRKKTPTRCPALRSKTLFSRDNSRNAEELSYYPGHSSLVLFGAWLASSSCSSSPKILPDTHQYSTPTIRVTDSCPVKSILHRRMPATEITGWYRKRGTGRTSRGPRFASSIVIVCIRITFKAPPVVVAY